MSISKLAKLNLTSTLECMLANIEQLFSWFHFCSELPNYQSTDIDIDIINMHMLKKILTQKYKN